MNELENISVGIEASQKPDCPPSLSKTNDVNDELKTDSQAETTDSFGAFDGEITQLEQVLPAEFLSQINERFDGLCQWMNEANRIAQDRERIIDRLHQENQQLRSGELQQAMMPVFRDLIRLHDDLLQTSQRCLAQSQASNTEAAEDFRSYSDAVADILFRYGVERYEAAAGEPFNPKEHRALAAVPTAEQNLDRTIAKVIRFGFRAETRNVRLLEAEVYRATPAEQTQTVSTDQPSQNQPQTTDGQ